MEFGFELSPPQMNETGRAILVNAIVYISKFTQDRPILKVPMDGVQRPPLRASLSRMAADEKISIGMLEQFLTKETLAAAPGKDRESYKRWIPTVLPYLRLEDSLKYGIDAEAQSLGLHPDQPDFPARAVSLLHSGGAKAGAARILLERYIPEGPAKGSDAAAWERWIQLNSPYLFFSDAGGVRWYIDPLARKRRIPTAKLRGAARADRPGGR